MTASRFPCLSVLRRAGPAWPVGRDVPLGADGFALWKQDGVFVERPLGAREVFLRLVPEAEGYRAEPGKGGHGMHVNGIRGASRTLTHGDVIGVEDIVFRFQTGDWPGPFDASREASLSDDDDRGWAVYCDWLIENGARQGVLLRAVPDVDEQARWLWPLAIDLQEARVEASFRHGRVAALRVRDPSLTLDDLEETLRLGDPVRALTSLSWVTMPSRSEGGAAFVLRRLLALRAPASLETLHLGFEPAWHPGHLEPILEQLKAGFARWRTTGASLVTVQQNPGEVRFEWVSGPWPFEGPPPLVLRAGTSVAFRARGAGVVQVRRGPPQLREDAVRVSHGEEGWRVLAPMNRPAVELPRLNGRALPFFRLAPGDLVELVPGLVLRFELD